MRSIPETRWRVVRNRLEVFSTLDDIPRAGVLLAGGEALKSFATNSQYGHMDLIKNGPPDKWSDWRSRNYTTQSIHPGNEYMNALS
jgi:hypothetical protein